MSKPINRADALAHARAIDALCKRAILLAVPRRSEAERLGCAILALILDAYRACLALMASQGEWHAPVLVRTMLESFAHIRALADDPGFADRMKLRAAAARKRVISDYINVFRVTPEFRSTAERATREHAELEQLTARLQSRGVRDYRVFDCFRLAGINAITAYVYGDLSSFAHADYIAIMTRNHERESLRLGTPLTDEWFAKVIVLSSTILIDALNVLPSFTTVNVTEIQRLRDRAIAHYGRLPRMP